MGGLEKPEKWKQYTFKWLCNYRSHYYTYIYLYIVYILYIAIYTYTNIVFCNEKGIEFAKSQYYLPTTFVKGVFQCRIFKILGVFLWYLDTSFLTSIVYMAVLFQICFFVSSVQWVCVFAVKTGKRVYPAWNFYECVVDPYNTRAITKGFFWCGCFCLLTNELSSGLKEGKFFRWFVQWALIGHLSEKDVCHFRSTCQQQLEFLPIP